MSEITTVCTTFFQMISFLYGQYRDDVDTQVLQCLFDQLAARNEYCIRGFHLPAPSLSTPTGSEGKVKVPRGILQDLSTSFKCLAECQERQDAISTITQSLPQRYCDLYIDLSYLFYTFRDLSVFKSHVHWQRKTSGSPFLHYQVVTPAFYLIPFSHKQ